MIKTPMQQMKEYNELLAKESFYTSIEPKYWLDNDQIGTAQYVRSKLGLNDDAPITWDVLFRACVEFPEICAFFMLGIRVRPYQHKDIDTMKEYRYVAKAWSRRLGKTMGNRLFLLHSARFNKHPADTGSTTWNIILQDQDVANDLYIEPLHEMMEKADRVTAQNFNGKLGQKFWTSALLTVRDKAGKVKASKISMRIKNLQIEPDKFLNLTEGYSRIVTFAPTKKAIGREGNLMGDEVSKWKENPKCKDEFKFYDQLIAILKDNPIYKGIFSSTPEGAEDLFALEIFDPDQKQKDSNYVKIWYPYWARRDEHWLTEIKKTEDNSMQNKRHHIFRQEYEAKFETISNPFFDTEKVMAVTNADWREGICINMPCSLGLDWGGSEKSETSWVVTKWDSKAKSKRKVIAMKSYPVGDDLIYLENDLKQIKKRYNIKWVTPDNKGGRWMMPRLEQMFGKGRVHPLNFTTDKKAGYEKLRQAITDKMINIPNDTKLIKQIINLTEDLKPSSSKGKDDMVDALMMSLYPIYDTELKEFKVLRYN